MFFLPAKVENERDSGSSRYRQLRISGEKTSGRQQNIVLRHVTCPHANSPFANIRISRVPSKIYFRFLLVWLNRLKNKLLANYLRNRGNELATVRISAFCVAVLSNNSFYFNSTEREYIGWSQIYEKPGRKPNLSELYQNVLVTIESFIRNQSIAIYHIKLEYSTTNQNDSCN